MQSGGVLGRFLQLLLKTGLPLMKNVLKSLAKSVLIPLELVAKRHREQQLQEYIKNS